MTAERSKEAREPDCMYCCGIGWIVEPRCCGRSRFTECCGDPDPEQVQCEKCGGTGKDRTLSLDGTRGKG